MLRSRPGYVAVFLFHLNPDYILPPGDMRANALTRHTSKRNEQPARRVHIGGQKKGRKISVQIKGFHGRMSTANFQSLIALIL